MKKPLQPIVLSLVSLACIASLAGCSGFDNVAFPPSSSNPEQVELGPINGSVFGGHAPLVGAHVYLLQATSAGYGSPAVSLLTSTTSASYPVVLNTGDPIIPTYGAYSFQTTDANGAFNLTGDYTCTSGPNGTPGLPVYIYAYGGSPATPLASNIFSVNKVVVGTPTGTGNAEKATYTFTLTSPVTLTAGEYVNLSAFTGTSVATVLNGQSSAVATATTNSTTFTLTLPDPSGAYTGTYSLTGTATAQPAFNPATVNLALLGNCPSSKNFASSISYVYMNEVSTVAAAYSMAGFTSSTPASINALNIGTSTTNLYGLENAALNANQLYDIQGSVVGTGTNGEGHIARATTPVGTGTVPQKLIDSIANSLAACVDSGNIVGTQAATCTTLFAYATADGTATGVKPIDTATAAINLAHNPYSSVTNYVSKIFGLPTGQVPFSPILAAAPNDFTVAISYTGGGMGPSVGAAPHSVAVDGNGNVWAATANSTIAEFSPLGLAAATNGYTYSGMNLPTSVTLDAASAYVWEANPTTFGKFTTGGQYVSQYTPGGTILQDLAFDSSGNAWVSSGGSNQLDLLPSGGTTWQHFTGNGLNFPDGLAIEPGISGNIWMPSGNANHISVFTHTGAAFGFGQNPAGYSVAIDSAGYVWISSLAGTVSKYSSTGNEVNASPFATGAPQGSANVPGGDGIAIDGGNNVWIASGSSRGIYKLSNAGANMSGTNGYSPTTNQPDGLAIDGSGNVWYNSLDDSTLTEIVGSAVPVVTPIALGVQNNTLGTKP